MPDVEATGELGTEATVGTTLGGALTGGPTEKDVVSDAEAGGTLEGDPADDAAWEVEGPAACTSGESSKDPSWNDGEGSR